MEPLQHTNAYFNGWNQKHTVKRKGSPKGWRVGTPDRENKWKSKERESHWNGGPAGTLECLGTVARTLNELPLCDKSEILDLGVLLSAKDYFDIAVHLWVPKRGTIEPVP